MIPDPWIRTRATPPPCFLSPESGNSQNGAKKPLTLAGPKTLKSGKEGGLLAYRWYSRFGNKMRTFINLFLRTRKRLFLVQNSFFVQKLFRFKKFFWHSLQNRPRRTRKKHSERKRTFLNGKSFSECKDLLARKMKTLFPDTLYLK